jgi:hypothetical protein
MAIFENYQRRLVREGPTMECFQPGWPSLVNLKWWPLLQPWFSLLYTTSTFSLTLLILQVYIDVTDEAIKRLSALSNDDGATMPMPLTFSGLHVAGAESLIRQESESGQDLEAGDGDDDDHILSRAACASRAWWQRPRSQWYPYEDLLASGAGGWSG